MASDRAVITMLKALNRVFEGTVDDETAALYVAALADLTDAQIETATRKVVAEYARPFIPPPAVIRAAAGVKPPPKLSVDTGPMLRRIRALGTYNANVGMIWPSVETVRQHLGQHAAYALASAGGSDLLFSDDATTRSIAERDFTKALTMAIEYPDSPDLLPIIGADVLGPGVEERQRQLRRGTEPPQRVSKVLDARDDLDDVDPLKRPDEAEPAEPPGDGE